MQSLRRLISFWLLLVCAASAGDNLRVTTWNLQWFPSGSPKMAAPEQEAATIAAAAKVLTIINPDVVLLQEVRDWDACQRLAAALAPAKYHVLICSAFREGAGPAVSAQQVAILSKIEADGAWAAKWQTTGPVDPPRGFAFAVIPVGKKQQSALYSVHLKSNLTRGNAERESQKNILKRETSAEQLLAHSRQMKSDYPRLRGIIIGGDFNTNPDQDLFVSEKTLRAFVEAGFSNPIAALPKEQRVTHPGTGRYPNATFDYLFAKGIRPARPIEILPTTASDHFPVTVEFEAQK